MTPEINQLFAEGITRSQELTDAADAAMNAVDETAKEAEQLAQRVQEEGRQACQHMRELATRLEHEAGELESQRGQAEGALEGLAGKAGELAAEAGELLARVKKGLSDLHSQTDEVGAVLEGHATSVQHEFQDMAQKTHEAQVQLDQQLQQAEQAVAAFRQAIDGGRAELAHKQQDWASALHHLATAAHDQAQAWAGGLSDLLARQSAAVTAAVNAMVDDHNAAMNGMRHRFSEQAPQELAAALDPLEKELERLGQEAAQHGDSLGAECRSLEQSARDHLPPLEALQGALQAAAHLG